MTNYTQEQIFVFFFIIGIILSLIFDFLRVLRRNIKTSDTVTFIEDLIFIGISIFLISLGILKLNNGIIRFFLFIGIFCGILIYSLTISNLCVIIFTVIVRICKYIFIKLKKCLLIILKSCKHILKKDF